MAGDGPTRPARATLDRTAVQEVTMPEHYAAPELTEVGDFTTDTLGPLGPKYDLHYWLAN
ncbi:lasso RiPP family leader peptide-containing protein [Saccharopolyspora cebuensis]|uniref:Lasso RiPP family leader peptide-containing protein n=1 Tax=Saccharopolyspora cebuensis TaxID=418759 RepID=A0ABV4CLL7_9PSEU